jgi:hypothetical protein
LTSRDRESNKRRGENHMMELLSKDFNLGKDSKGGKNSREERFQGE